jgi:signal peptidase I
MEPTLYIDDVILINVTKEDLKINDIIAFNNDNAIITHRIVFIDGDTLTVKGDNNNTIDVPINKDQVIGKVIKVFPKFGVWKKVITEPKILIAIFVTLLLFDFALSYDGKGKKKDKEIKDKQEIETVIVSSEIPKEKDIIESDELLSLTRKIDLDEINKMLEESDSKTTLDEVSKVKEEIERTPEVIEKPKEKKEIDYTVRLDLNEIHKKVDERMR